MNPVCGEAPPGRALGDPVPQFGRPVRHVDQVDPAQDPAVAVAVDQDVEVAEPGLLLGEQRPEPLVEVREVVVAPVGYRRGEVRPVLLFELQKRGGVVGAEAFESGHASMLGPPGLPA